MLHKKRFIFGILIVFLLLASFIAGCLGSDDNGEEEEEENGNGEPIPGSLIDPADLVYQGAFRLPEPADWNQEENSWSWGGRAMTYYPGGDADGQSDGYPGSIFGTGHEQYQYICELSIPEPVISATKDLGELNMAENLQDFRDIKGDMFGELELPRAGLEYLPKQGSQSEDKLYYTWGQHMQELDSGPSHGWFDLDLSDPNVQGPWRIQDQVKYNTTDYIFEIPANWAQENTPGYRLVTGRFRDGGQGSQGPVMIAYGPWNDGNPPSEGAALANTPLLLYSSVYDDASGNNAMDNYHHSDEWSGGAWLTKGDKASVVFVGIKGQGDCWYGFYDGTVWPEEPPYPPEGPGERGWWSDSFIGQMIFYDPSDLAKVASGDMEPYEPQPYATLNINDLLWNRQVNEIQAFGAVSFDRENGLLYAFEFRGDADNDNPLVHVWKIN